MGHIPFVMLSIVFLFSNSLKGQTIQTYSLPNTLKEISGLEFLTPSRLVAINDSGDAPKLYVLTLDGTVVKTVVVRNAQNTDWEDLTIDDQYVYIGDIGNNGNLRKELVIYRVRIEDILHKENIWAEKISFSYTDQLKYPPSADRLFYDAEALAYFQGNLLIFTKNRSKPSSGTTRMYKVPTTPGTYSLTLDQEIPIGDGAFWKDAVTAADIVGDTLYLMTYNRILIKSWKNGRFMGNDVLKFSRITQKESLVVSPENDLFIADEKQPFWLGGNLYHIQR